MLAGANIGKPWRSQNAPSWWCTVMIDITLVVTAEGLAWTRLMLATGTEPKKVQALAVMKIR